MNDNDLSMTVFWARAFRGNSPQSLSDALGVLAGLIDDPTPFMNCADAIRSRNFVAQTVRAPARSILFEVGEKYGLSISDLKSQRRSRAYAWPRQEAYFRLRSELKLSLPHIARIMGWRDHTTILYGIKKYMMRESVGGRGITVPGLPINTDGSDGQPTEPEPRPAQTEMRELQVHVQDC